MSFATTISAYALLTESQALAQLGLAVSTDQMAQLVNGVTKRIEDHLLRKILSRTYTGEIYDWPANGELVLNQPDVTAVGLVANSTESVLRIAYAGAATHARVEVTDVSLILTSRVGATTTTTTTLFSAQATTTALAALSVSGWTFTLAKDVPSAYLVRTGAQPAKDRTITLEAWADYDGTYQTNYPAGIIRFDSLCSWPSGSDPYINPAVRNQLRIDYTAGLAAVPDGVAMVAMELLSAAWGRIARDPALQSESLGDYAYSVAIPQINTQERWMLALSTYRRELP